MRMRHPPWVILSFLSELIGSYIFAYKDRSNPRPTGYGRPNLNCANDTEVIDNLLKDSYNKHYIPSYPVQFYL